MELAVRLTLPRSQSVTDCALIPLGTSVGFTESVIGRSLLGSMRLGRFWMWGVREREFLTAPSCASLDRWGWQTRLAHIQGGHVIVDGHT